MIFISYSSKQKAQAGLIKEQLSKARYESFLAHEDIEETAEWASGIWDQLQRCSAFVAVITKSFHTSVWCQQEVGAALALSKPSLFVTVDKLPKGFASRYQAARQSKIIEVLDTKPQFRRLRVEAWTSGVRLVRSYADANALYDRFGEEWSGMEQEEKFAWVLAASGNGQVTNEGFRAGPFYAKQRKALRPKMSQQWLYENDKKGQLHNPSKNPLWSKEELDAF